MSKDDIEAFLEEQAAPDDFFVRSSVPPELGGDPSADLEYFSLEPHPRAKDIYDKFNSNTKQMDATLGEVEHFRNLFPEIEFHLFFGGPPTNFNFYYTPIEHNIRSYTLRWLADKGEIGLHAYDPSAALSTLKTGPTTEVLSPATGRFVITFDSKEFILYIERHPHNVEWSVYAPSAAAFSAFDKTFRNAIKECNYYKGKVFDHKGRFINLPAASFDDIYLDDRIRQEVKSNIIDYLDEDSLAVKRKNGIPTKRGVVFVGEPGTGKTFLSRVLANTLNTTFLVVTELSNIEEIDYIFNLAATFERVVLLFEDIDIYIKDRTMGSMLLPTMLNHLDGMVVNTHTVVICTTNDVEAMDKALKNRPGRFDRILTFSAPSTELKAIMLKGFCDGKDAAAVDFPTVAAALPASYTGAHLKEVYITACNQAIDIGSLTSEKNVILTTDIFLKAVELVKGRNGNLNRIGFGTT